METWREGARTGHTHEPNEVTIQLDGLGRQLSELLPEPGVPEGSDGPVFVDESGRRGKTLRRLGWVLAAICVGYAVTLVVALLGGNSSAPSLPLSGQEEHRTANEVQTPAPPGASPGSQASPGTAPDVSASATPRTGGNAAVPAGAGSSTAPAAETSASAPVVPSARHTGTGSDTVGGAPGGGTSASTPVVGPGTASGDPATAPADPATSTAGTPDPPVQEQEGAS